MSKERIQKITCPECGQEIEMVIWDSLNGDLDPEAKAQLLNGTLFIITSNSSFKQSP